MMARRVEAGLPPQLVTDPIVQGQIPTASAFRDVLKEQNMKAGDVLWQEQGRDRVAGADFLRPGVIEEMSNPLGTSVSKPAAAPAAAQAAMPPSAARKFVENIRRQVERGTMTPEEGQAKIGAVLEKAIGRAQSDQLPAPKVAAQVVEEAAPAAAQVAEEVAPVATEVAQNPALPGRNAPPAGANAANAVPASTATTPPNVPPNVPPSVGCSVGWFNCCLVLSS